jgi:nitrile hydratase
VALVTRAACHADGIDSGADACCAKITAMDGVHDLGGMHGFGRVPIEVDEPLFHERWEGRVWVMLRAVMAHTTIDRFRYTIEQMPPAQYLASSYYERWLWAVERLAAEQGLLDGGDAPPTVKRPSPRMPTWTGRFQPGDPVRVANPVTAGHTRVPRYLRRHVGRVERAAFVWPPPAASAATGRYGEPELVYTVAFRGSDLFGPAADHTVTADLGESDLETP